VPQEDNGLPAGLTCSTFYFANSSINLIDFAT
jgi:hypothetical protein